MFRAITYLLGAISRIATILKIAVVFIVCNASNIYKSVASNAIRSIDMIRLIGASVVLLYAMIGSVQAGNMYSGEVNEIDQSSIVKTITGASEIKCILLCSRDTHCDRSVFEKKIHGGTSLCHFLKDEVNPSNGNNIKRSGIVHEKISPPTSES